MDPPHATIEEFTAEGYTRRVLLPAMPEDQAAAK
jgi:hypothetical protein